MSDSFDLQRFVMLKPRSIGRSSRNCRGEKKRTHWMWFIFPQIAGLGFSAMTQRFARRGRRILGARSARPRLLEGTRFVLAASEKTIADILGSPVVHDTVRRSLEAGIFAESIAAFFPDGKDRATLEILETSRLLQ